MELNLETVKLYQKVRKYLNKNLGRDLNFLENILISMITQTELELSDLSVIIENLKPDSTLSVNLKDNNLEIQQINRKPVVNSNMISRSDIKTLFNLMSMPFEEDKDKIN